MVNFTDLKFYKSASGGLGGAIDTAAELNLSDHNNLFSRVDRGDLIGGETFYRCMYLKNTSAETMENFKIRISTGTPLDYTNLNFAFDPTANPFDGSVGFDGTDDYLDCTNDANLWSKSLTKFCFSFWIYPTAAWDGNERTVVSHGGASPQGFRCIIDSTAVGRIKFIIKDSGGNNKEAHSDDLVKNDWNLVTCSFDNSLGNDNVVIYVRDVIGSQTADYTGTINLSSTLTLADSSTDFKGYIRDFKFWDDERIDGDEAEQIANDEFTVEPSYHLPFSERTGSTTIDTVSGTKVATLTNGAFWKLDALSISDHRDAPTGIEDWFGSDDDTGASTKLKAGQSFPIWVRLAVDPDSEATSVEDDHGVFTVQFDITASGGTGSGGTPGTGGGGGGNPTPSTDFKVCFAGDWGCEPETNDVISLIKSEDYDLVIGVGDNAYEKSGCWTSNFNSLKSKMESAFGNHEYSESGGISPYKNFFGYSSTHNSIRFQNMLILLLDDNDFEDGSAPSLDSEKTWAQGELNKYKNDANVVWRIVVTHHPPFGDGGKHPANEGGQVQKLHKMFTDAGVNFWYCGHDHNWHRTHSVAYDSGSPKTPNIVDATSPYTRTSGGLINIVSGTGGHDSGGSLYSLFTDAAFWAYRNKSNNGVHELVASNDGRTLTGKFRNTDGDTFDTFTITA